MSNIQRYVVDAYSKHDWSLEADNFGGDLVKYDDHAAIVAQLEAELAEARKDQARYKFMRDMKPIDFGNLPVNYTDFDRQIDAMIKGQQ